MPLALPLHFPSNDSFVITTVSCDNFQMQVSDYQPSKAPLLRLACKSNYAPVPLVDPELQEIGSLMKVEKRLAQKFGMASPEDVDSVTVLQETRRRAKLPWGRFQSAIRVFLRRVRTLTSDSDNAKELHRLYHLRLKDASNPRHSPSISCESPTLNRGALYHVDASRFWAVLIGIDAYASNPLHGCVSDALSMKKLLLENVGVPEHRIQCLLSARKPSHGDPLTPSRANIVKLLRSLIDNPEIERGDNIIIYYAGHGSSYHCSEYFSTSLESKCGSSDACPIEALCPIDRDTIDADGRPIPDISDRELNSLFTKISRVKGHKITFIADCCYAGGMSRDPDQEIGLRVTRATLRSNVDDMLCAANGYSRSVLSKNWVPDMSSHVVLAACRDYQYAKETLGKDGYGGVFTKTLVSVLKSGDWKETTYVGLTERLNQDYFQTPVVAGDRKYEHLWYQ